MKFKTLTIHNIASIGDAAIHFDESPLANEKIFLVCGETGSGKSTILDSICLALYNTSPRISKANSRESYFDENMTESNKKNASISDTRQYLKKGCNEGWIVLTFEGNDGDTYTSEYRLGKNRNGNLRDVEWTLTNNDTKEILCKIREIEAKMMQIIGLSFAQFCRTTMLAQGEFKKFLDGNETDKAEILEKLTGTEIYSTIGKRIYETCKSKEDELKKEESRKEGIVLLTDEEIADKNKEKSGLDTLIAQQNQQKAALVEKQKWLNDEGKLRSELENASKNEQKAQQQKDDDAENERIVTDWHDTIDERNAFAKLRETEQKMNRCRQNEGTLLSNFKCLERNEVKRKNQLQQMASKSRELEDMLQKQARHEAMFDESQLIVGELNHYLSDMKQSEGFANKARTEQQGLPQLQQQLDKTTKELDGITARLAQTDTDTKNRSKLLENPDFANLDERKDTTAEMSKNLSSVKSQIEICNQLRNNVEDYKSQIEKADNELKTNKEALLTLSTKEAAAEKEAKQAEELYHRQVMSVGDYVKNLRNALHPGDKCPVCGQTIGTIAHDSEFEAALAPIKEDFEKKKKAFEQLKDDRVKTEAAIRQIESDDDERQKKLAANKDEYQKALDKLNRLCLATGLDADSPNLPSELEAKIDKNNSESARIGYLTSQRKAINDDIDKLRSTKDDLLIRERKISNIKTSCEKNMSEAKARIAQNLKLADEKNKSANSALHNVKGKITYPDWQDDIKATLGRINDEALRYKNDKQQLQNLKNDIQKQETEFHKASKLYRSIIGIDNFGGWREATGCQHIAQSSYNWEGLYGEAVSLNREINAAIEEKNKCQTIIDRAISTHDNLTLEYLEKLSGITDDERKMREARIEKLKNDLEAARGAKRQAERSLQAHWETKPHLSEDDTCSVLSQKIDAIASSIDENNKKVGAIEQSLSDNAKNMERHADLLRSIQLKKAELDKWLPINDLLGDKEGKTFRKVAQTYVLRQLLVYANEQLKGFSDRYEMLCQDSLTILVKDFHNGGTIRPISMVSGGESFILSLALALGLSSLSSNTISSDILFIDEGFGTLSSDVLDTVMNTLGSLSVRRRVGVISHIETLRERIPVKLLVESVNGNTSVVRVVTG